MKLFTDDELDALIAEAQTPRPVFPRALSFSEFRRWTAAFTHVLSPKDEKLLRTWSREGYTDINTYVRQSVPAVQQFKRSEISHAKTPDAHRRMMQGAAQVIDEMFAKAPVAPRAFPAFRGMSVKQFPLPLAKTPDEVAQVKDRLVGNTVTLSGYTACSLRKDIALQFASEYEIKSAMQIILMIPAGARVLPVPAKYAGVKDEMEILLPHQSRIRLTGLTFGPYARTYASEDIQTVYAQLLP